MVMNLEYIKNDYDWREAFEYADGFAMDDIQTIANLAEGQHDGDDWVIYGQLKNGKWFYLSAGCDYTGWDCQASGTSGLEETRDLIERLHLTSKDRDRLNVKRDNDNE